MRADQLETLGWLRRYGMGIAERLDRYARGLLLSEMLQEPFEDVDVTLAFSRIAKSIRQIIVLEQETAGIREMRVPQDVAQRTAARAERAAAEERAAREIAAQVARELASNEDNEADDPVDRDDTQDYDDYRAGPAEEIIAEVRATLDAMPDAGLVAQRLNAAPDAMLEPLTAKPAAPAEPAAPADQPSPEAAPSDAADDPVQRIIAAMMARRGTGPP